MNEALRIFSSVKHVEVIEGEEVGEETLDPLRCFRGLKEPLDLAAPPRAIPERASPCCGEECLVGGGIPEEETQTARER